MSAAPRRLCWVVTHDDTPLGDVLARLGAPAQVALDEGRVFVAGRRASDATARLRAGTPVEVTAGREAGDDDVALLDARDGIVAAYKPPALPTEPDRAGGASARRVVSRRLDIPEAGIHALSRLDVGVSGVVLFATSADARRRVQAARAAGALARRYVAISAGVPEPAVGRWSESVASRPACTRYACVASAALIAPGDRRRAALLAVEPISGRTHQIRVHAAGAGTPLVGDRAHGGPARLCAADGGVSEVRRIALHAAWVELRDGADVWRVAADVPGDLHALWHTLGGDPGGWPRAIGEAGFDDGVE